MHYENYTSASTEAHKFFAGAKRPKGRAHRGRGGLQWPYNVSPYRILGTKKIPKSRLLRKIERGDRNIYNDYIAFCRWHGRQVKSIKFLPCKRPKGRAPQAGGV